jgi:hypothetical protein
MFVVNCWLHQAEKDPLIRIKKKPASAGVTTRPVSGRKTRFLWHRHAGRAGLTVVHAQKKEPLDSHQGVQKRSGGVLLSHTVSRAVPLAMTSLTSEFEMGSGVTLPL